MKKKILQSYISVRKPPKNLNESDIELFSHEFEKKIQESHFLTVRNVYVLNTYLYKIFPLSFFFKYVYFYLPSVRKILKDILRNFFKSKINVNKKEIENAIWITDNKTAVYFHFLCDALGRYYLLPNSIKMKQIPIILPEKYNIDWIKEILTYLNIDYLPTKKDNLYKVNNLLVPYYPAPSGNFHKENLSILRNEFINNKNFTNKTQEPYKKVWFSRNKARRQLSNFEEVSVFLKNEGFEIINFEDYSTESKLELMQKTKIIAGLHGSGLTNALFMQNKTFMLDVRDPKDNIKNAFFSLASEVGVNYYYIEREDSKEYFISIDKLKKVLNQIYNDVDYEK